jgi:hypothetical protein
MTFNAVKEFEVHEGSTEGMWYRISVYFNGQFVEEFLKPTMREARQAFLLAGYKTANFNWQSL